MVAALTAIAFGLLKGLAYMVAVLVAMALLTVAVFVTGKLGYQYATVGWEGTPRYVTILTGVPVHQGLPKTSCVVDYGVISGGWLEVTYYQLPDGFFDDLSPPPPDFFDRPKRDINYGDSPLQTWQVGTEYLDKPSFQRRLLRIIDETLSSCEREAFESVESDVSAVFEDDGSYIAYYFYGSADTEVRDRIIELAHILSRQSNRLYLIEYWWSGLE